MPAADELAHALAACANRQPNACAFSWLALPLLAAAALPWLARFGGAEIGGAATAACRKLLTQTMPEYFGTPYAAAGIVRQTRPVLSFRLAPLCFT